MKKYIISTFLLLFTFTSDIMLAQSSGGVNIDKKKTTFVDLYLGTQVSGIRKEDYVASNFAPFFQFSIGNWFTPYLALAVSYQGPYFNYIGDNVKHNYLYIDGAAIFDVNRLIDKEYNGLWSISLVGGSGYFHNYVYGRPNICATAGIIAELKLKNNFSLKCKLSNIMGWDIYQGDEDILTSISIGGSMRF